MIANINLLVDYVTIKGLIESSAVTLDPQDLSEDRTAIWHGPSRWSVQLLVVRKQKVLVCQLVSRHGSILQNVNYNCGCILPIRISIGRFLLRVRLGKINPRNLWREIGLSRKKIMVLR